MNETITKGHFSEEQIDKDLLKNVNWGGKFKLWMGFLTVSLIICLYYYYQQLQNGLGVTGLHDYVSWGIYISNFVFFVATSLIGMLVSSVLGMMKVSWVRPVARIAELVAVAFAMVAGLIIITDMGRPDRLLNVFIHGRVQSPIVWDIAVVVTYVVISALLLYIPMLPDIALCRDKLNNVPKWQQKMYKSLSLGWNSTAKQFRLMNRYTRILLVLIIPIALSIHTVTSWLFAMTLRSGWDSPIFGPYFVSGAFVAGCAAVIIAMFFFRNNYKLKEYITADHFDRMGKLLVLVALVYVYFNINEIIVPGYKANTADAKHVHEMLYGHDSVMFWLVQLGGLVVPFLLILFKPMRKPLPLTIISLVILAGAWFKRVLIVVPTQLAPYYPIQNVPEGWTGYSPTTPEVAITVASFILVLMIITVLAKLFPVVPIWEVKEDMNHKNN
ncbi:NrfD/PsrC family molybdoenzyme membrane anchor subunit [Marinifilum flexuosum]|uniref:Molybdopterin-containing oxidoreductase family membrane subunit n=1 Tax=Marinifilum flexuosum TaxID=1117708 RepID=A0A419X799_9BACT|nr:NrfD/PsrC family molybdoenzyme membrane anchor subunit [Marinifilum flexuosum]RKE03489.1 molybdopterin-containing oxidoreductase family membrane subunit [Marinifilum flexuosum]